MNIKRFSSVFVMLAITLSLFAANNYAEIIPAPAHVNLQEKSFTMPKKIAITYISKAINGEATLLKEALAKHKIEASIKYTDVAPSKGIILRLDNSISNPEGYRIDVTRNKIEICGGSPAGVFYGTQSLIQELTAGGIRLGSISDAPRYGWRGFMLDEARHFSGEKRVKEILDIMAYYKMNRFHWHLTDAQGWRIEIKRYPKLATIGGIGCHSNPDTPTQYYTQDQIKDIVEYAAARHIEIIPEIDMPGHATAANKAYPEYSGGGTEEHPDFTFNVGKEETYTFLTNILTEIGQLFPTKYMHIGGDEVAYGSQAWESDPYVQDLMKRNGLKTVKEAERYFMHRMTDVVKSLNKTLIGWDELLDLNVDKNSTEIMWWRHDKPENLKRSLDSGYTTILCPRKPLYFDFVQHESHKVGRIWDGFCPLDYVYSFPDTLLNNMNLSQQELSHIKGIQANAWSELLHNTDRVDFMIFPRLCALAEAGWSDANVKDYSQFMQRMENAFALFDKLGIYYFDPRDPSKHPEPVGPIIIKRKPAKMDFRD